VTVSGKEAWANRKVKSLDDVATLVDRERRTGQRVVHCHGVFDLLHIGHIRHFEQAKAMGELLVVTLTPDEHVNKGPHRPAFPEGLRAEAVAALDCVDFVSINRWPMAVEAIRKIKPDFYVKGSDYRDADKDRTGGIALEEEAIRLVGGQLAFTDDIVFSSSTLINRNFAVFPEEVQEYLQDFSNRYTEEQVLGYLEAAKDLKVLVVGEAIIDEYCYCDAIGKSSKEPMLALKQGRVERFAGGSLAVANHVAAFADHVKLVTQLGAERPHTEFVTESLRPNVEPVFLERRDAPTIVKRRFVENYFFTKLLAVYEMNDEETHPSDDEQLCLTLREALPEYDLVIVMDFGHGMMSERSIEELSHGARFLAVNVQSNAGNKGYHTVSRYPRADFISLAENEARLESRDRRGDLRQTVSSISSRLGCDRIIVTRGKYGCLCYSDGHGFVEVPALAGEVVDRMGAGDAFLSVTSLCVVQDAPMDVVGFIGNAVGAQAVATVGHRTSTEATPLFKHIKSLLK